MNCLDGREASTYVISFHLISNYCTITYVMHVRGYTMLIIFYMFEVDLMHIVTTSEIINTVYVQYYQYTRIYVIYGLGFLVHEFCSSYCNFSVSDWFVIVEGIETIYHTTQ